MSHAHALQLTKEESPANIAEDFSLWPLSLISQGKIPLRGVDINCTRVESLTIKAKGGALPRNAELEVE